MDKAGGIVILKKMNRLFSDRSTYVPLASNPKAKFKRELKSLIDEGFQQVIQNKKERAYLVPRIPVVYYLPPGRPIISSIDSVTSRIGRYVDTFLQPLVTATLS